MICAQNAFRHLFDHRASTDASDFPLLREPISFTHGASYSSKEFVFIKALRASAQAFRPLFL